MSANTNEDPALGAYFKTIPRRPFHTMAEESALSERIRNGDLKAQKELIEANLRFVIRVAKNYVHQGLDLADLVAIGNIGLIRAARSFEGEKNIKFISYAVWWIRQTILAALADQSRIVRIPVNVATKLFRMRKIRDSLSNKNSFKVSNEDLASAMKLPLTEIEMLLSLEISPVWLNAPVDENGTEYVELLPAAEEPVYETNDEDLAVQKALDKLTDRERLVIKAYYGLEGEDPKNLEQIAVQIDLTRERVRQIKVRALQKLKAHTVNITAGMNALNNCT
jgi:RNA polymerase primary sigma factor